MSNKVEATFHPNLCPVCKKEIYVSFKWGEWACSDPECVNAH